MDRDRWERLQKVFLDAVECPEPVREAFVRVAACGDEELVRDVLAMLKGDVEADSIIDKGLASIAVNTVCASRDFLSSPEFAPYELQEFLGEGGMGVVYLARHRENGKLVAIKLLLDARLSPARRERFAREQRILANLDHRNIAQLYHSDVLADGTPWFAMEYVGPRPGVSYDGARALPLDAWCRKHNCTMEARIRLFRAVCEAVQYVHGQLLIHRDLKPSNVLVTEDGTPKLIDFGIGKEQEDERGVEVRTVAGPRLMTLAYAAPEQIRRSAALPTTDIYALGVILYVLIAGRHPYDFSHCTTGEAERKIIEEEPQEPSVAAREDLVAPAATKSQWEDLNALCLKAMHKEARRRYQTVEALIVDLDNYLEGRPLKARPDGFAYKASKFIGRNRRTIGAAALAASAIAAMVVFFTLRLTHARDAALAEAARTDRVERFMLDLLQNGDSEVGPPEDMRVSTLIERGVKETQAMDRDPAIQGDLYQTLGDIYASWGKQDQALLLLNASLERRRQVYGADSAKAAESLLHLASWYSDQDQLAQAEQTIREVLAMQRRRLAPGDPAIARTLSAMGAVLQKMGREHEAISVLNQAVAVQSVNPTLASDLASSLTLLANAQFDLGNYEASDELNRQALALDRQVHGERHPEVAEDLVNLATLHFKLERYPAAESYYRQALDIQQFWYGRNHPNTADVTTQLAQVLEAEGKLDEAQKFLNQALETLDSIGEGRPQMRVALMLNARGLLEQRRGDLKAAEADFQRSADIYASIYGYDHRNTAIALGNLGSIYLSEQNYAKAEEKFRDVLARYSRALSADPLDVGIARIRLGRTLVFEKRYREAEAELLEGYRLVSQRSGPSTIWLQNARADLASTYEALHEPEKAALYRAEFTAQGSERGRGQDP